MKKIRYRSNLTAGIVSIIFGLIDVYKRQLQ